MNVSREFPRHDPRAAIPASGAGRPAAVCLPAGPHELLGLSADVVSPRLIIEAARLRLRAVRASRGSELAVKRFVIGQIVSARGTMLAAARRRGRC